MPIYCALFVLTTIFSSALCIIPSLFFLNPESALNYVTYSKSDVFSQLQQYSDVFTQQLIVSHNHSIQIRSRLWKGNFLVDVVIMQVYFHSYDYSMCEAASLNTFCNILMSPYTILVLIRQRIWHNFQTVRSETISCPIWSYESPLPAIVIRLLKSRRTPSVYLTPDSIIARNIASVTNKLDILKLNKRYFRAGKGEVYEAYVPWASLEIETYLSCDDLYKNREYFMARYEQYCYAKLMLANQLALAHNFSIGLIPENFSYTNYHFKNVIHLDILDDFGVDWHGELYLQYYSGSTYYYCLQKHYQNQETTIQYAVWLNSVSNLVWCLWIFAIFLVALVYQVCSASVSLSCAWRVQNYFKNLINVFLVLHRSASVYVIRIRCLHILMTMAGLFFGVRYENEITSLVTVLDAVKPFDTLVQLQTAGFKLYKGEDHTISRSELVSQKMSWSFSTRWRQWWYHHDKIRVKQELGADFNLMYVLEDVNPEPCWFLIFTKNRYWLMQTTRRIHEGGIMTMWDNRAFFTETNQNRDKFRSEVQADGPDVINLRKMLPVLILCLLTCAVSVLILLGECVKMNYVKGTFTCKCWLHLHIYCTAVVINKR